MVLIAAGVALNIPAIRAYLPGPKPRAPVVATPLPAPLPQQALLAPQTPEPTSRAPVVVAAAPRSPEPTIAEAVDIVPVRVIDGDTFDLPNGERVRILNIDTAEMPPRSACETERDLAVRAKMRLQQLMASGPIVLHAEERDRDRYGRRLRRVEIDGRDLGEQLIAEGLAQRWAGGKAQWC
ncbi:thermonuclease family protein [Caulobacter segnis]|uniref:thermonuclease family protein n=1 Tax=Caulobacter segnis TaxID=88688 RepID=UPI00240FC088|nr:thermonuclease family protein [Caulobacter segnis]MDG2522184.1 thermonuclease family protein [Caulobacter segnis]